MKMNVKKVVYLPLDERPCNYSFVGFLSEEKRKYILARPRLEVMGDFRKPADYQNIKQFLLEECLNADYLIIAIDTLLYGGIIPSRLHYLSKQELTERLNLIKQIRAKNPKIRIYGFSLVMRCPCYTDGEEEPDYYGICGREIFEYGQNEHKFKDGKITKEEYLKEKSRLAVAEQYLGDYLSRRELNLSLLMDALNLVGKEIDEFVILQDDSNPCGYTAMDQAKVRALIKEKNLKVDIYPGADEGGMTLLSRVVANIEGYVPKIYPIYPKEECKSVIPLFEDRAVYKSVKAQIESAGCKECYSEEDADILLFCNMPLVESHNIDNLGGVGYDERDLPAFLEGMKLAIAKGKGVALADIAYCNGGDVELASAVSKQIGLLNLWGYAGWNTSSNTLGTVICQAVLRYFYGNTPDHRRFTALRAFEDLGYCAYTRKQIWDNEITQMGYCYTDTKVQQGEVSERVEELLNWFMNENFKEITNLYEIEKCYMPWRRMFEVGLIVKEKQKGG